MFLARHSLDPWVLFVALMALASALWIARTVVATHRLRRPDPRPLPALAALAAICGVPSYGLGAMLAPLLAFLAIASLVLLAARRLSLPGASWLAVDFMGLGVGWLWSCLFIVELDPPWALKALALGGSCLTLGLAIAAAFERVARDAVFTHARWQLPTRTLGEDRADYALERAAATPRPRLFAASHYPKVSVHLPCYAEPPAMVMQTMDLLATLDYPDYEVLVCDNNTRDEALWRPLERHAARLNERIGRELFRFFHVAPIEGAKAGALNFLIGETAVDAELVAVIDADYHSRPDFLARLAPFFANPRLGYLQTPHDYRDYAASRYLSSCYAEYMPNNKIDMLGVHEYGGAFTIGTMCILRLAALKAVGGWAEWCLTEDSEVSVRLRAAGFHGLYFGETFGRGLIPATFDDYKKQRFRWTAGPVQQLRRHWRLFLPSPLGPKLPGWTKLLEVLRCAAPLMTLAQLAMAALVMVGTALAVHAGAIRPIDLPDVARVLVPLALATGLVRTWHRYRIAGTMRVAEMIRGEVARAALSWVVLVGGVAGLSAKPLAWRRTPKFAAQDSVAGALVSVWPETLIGLVCAGFAGLLAHQQATFGWEFAALSAAACAGMAMRFWCAPYLALLALSDLRRADAPAQEPVPEPRPELVPIPVAA